MISRSSPDWTSDRDGEIGTGASISISNLSVGSHKVTASVTDSGGLSGSSFVDLTITEPGPVPTIALGVAGRKLKGVIYVDLTWSGCDICRCRYLPQWREDPDHNQLRRPRRQHGREGRRLFHLQGL